MKLLESLLHGCLGRPARHTSSPDYGSVLGGLMMRRTFLKNSLDALVSFCLIRRRSILIHQPIGADHAMKAEDQEALAWVLPATELIDSQYAFCVHVSNLFKSASRVHEEILFAQLAISVAP